MTYVDAGSPESGWRLRAEDVPAAIRVDLHFFNDVGDRWVLEHATPAELREVADEMTAREAERP